MTTYGTIVADPPWRYRKSAKAEGTVHSRRFVDDLYPSMTNREIRDLPIKELAAQNAHLYLWLTNPRLYGERNDRTINPADIAEAWGFRYITTLTWVKQGAPGMGSYFRINTEHVLFGVRGKCPIPPRLRESNVIVAPKRRHSQKPDALFDLAERVSPAPRLELFARSARLGWDRWGNEVDSTVEVAA